MSRLFAVLSMALLLAAVLPVGTAARAPRAPEADLSKIRLDKPIRSTARSPLSRLDRSILGDGRRIDVVVRLSAAPTSRVAKGNVAKQLNKINGQQNAIIAALRKLDGKASFYGRTQVALNALLVKADARALDKLAADGRIASINRVHDYALDLSETVPHIGATDVQDLGLDGSGIRVAVLDTGIDYTHAAMGGPGDVKSYEIAYGKKTQHQQNRMINESYKGEKLFPTAKVVGGFDFVGEAWPNGALRPDPDPIDCSPTVIGCTGGHGTHVADIIGGVQAGKPGVAPGVEFYAVKVCSSVSPSCSGIALIQAMEFALDPNGDGSTADAVDIINMSLGSVYGQSPDDDLSQAVENATSVGVLTVASAGNSGDKPYVTGTPAAAPSALSVAQTHVPSATGFAMLISTDGSEPSIPRETVHQPWSKDFTEDDEVTNVPVQYGDTDGDNKNGCAAFNGDLTGMVVLVDRGTCDFSLKISNIAAAGGKIGVIGLIAPGDPFAGGLGACPDNLCAAIPGFMVHQTTSTQMKNSAARVTFDLDSAIALVGSMVGSSSRGPDNALNLIKPEIGAPGASVSAEVGTGTENTPFGGTSGAAPMVAGSAALLMDAYPGRTPLEVKAALINTGETNILNKPTVFGGDLAPITRIGGGEVRVDRAHATDAAAWEFGGSSSALSFGFWDVTEDATLTKTVAVRNYTASTITYDIASTFRFTNDATNGAISVTPATGTIGVPAMSTATFDVTVDIDGSALRAWGLDSGFAGASGATLQLLEYDGYIWLDAAGTDNDIHLPWQVLPRQASDISPSSTAINSGDTVTLTNNGAGTSWIGSFGLVAESPDDPGTGIGDNFADVDLRYVGVRTVDVLGCDAGWGLSFAASTWDRQVHANAPALFEFDLDLDQDGEADFFVFNLDLALGALGDGRNVTWVQNAATGALSAFFFTAHSTNSANTILTICGEQLGLDASAVGMEIDVLALAADWYNSGEVTDFATFSMVIGGDRYDATFANIEAFFGPFSQLGGVSLVGLAEEVTVVDNGATGTTPELGLLLTLDGNLFSPAGAPADNDTIIITVNEP